MARSPVAFRLAFRFAVRFAGILPIWNSRASATPAPAETVVW
jgi:hypothetical protein